MKLPFLSVVLFFVFCCNAGAQLTVYKTYQDFKNGTGQEYDNSYEYKEMSGSDAFGGYIIVFKNGKDKVTVKTGQVWGFKFKNELFRIAPPKSVPVVLYSSGKLCFYRNGMDRLHSLSGGVYGNSLIAGVDNYISETLESDISVFSLSMDKKLPGTLAKAKKRYPQGAKIFDCIGAATIHEDIDDCIKKMNKP